MMFPAQAAWQMQEAKLVTPWAKDVKPDKCCRNIHGLKWFVKNGRILTAFGITP